MCGRFSLAAPLKEIALRFDARTIGAQWKPRYNIAPGQAILTVLPENGEKCISSMTFGFIPHWAKEKPSGYTMINAKAETIAEKPSFRDSFRHKRCIIPADGFYEWEQTEKGKQPYRLTLKGDALFGFAGIWDSWTDPEGKFHNTVAIITTEANALAKKLHDRMPVILKKQDERVWLDPSLAEPGKLEPLLVPYPAKEMEMYPVSPLVNSWRNDSAECVRPL